MSSITEEHHDTDSSSFVCTFRLQGSQDLQ